MGARSTEAKGLSAALSAIPAVNALALLSGLIISGRWNLFGLWTLESTTGRSTGFLIWLGQDSNPALRVTLWTVATAATIPNESGFLLPEAMIIFGDTPFALSLAFGVALFINAWLPKCTTTEATST
jgi:hypothetical protein